MPAQTAPLSAATHKTVSVWPVTPTLCHTPIYLCAYTVDIHIRVHTKHSASADSTAPCSSTQNFIYLAPISVYIHTVQAHTALLFAAPRTTLSLSPLTITFYYTCIHWSAHTLHIHICLYTHSTSADSTAPCSTTHNCICYLALYNHSQLVRAWIRRHGPFL